MLKPEAHRPSPHLSRRGLLHGALGGATLAMLAACGSGSGSSSAASSSVPAKKDGDTLNLFSWDGYFAPESIKGFEKKHGITVKLTALASSSEQLQKLVAKQPFDVAIANSTFLPDVIKAGLLRTIDHDALDNWDEVISYFNDPYFDPGAKHSIGYAMAPVGIAYHKDLYPSLSGSWSDLWNHVADNPGHAYLLDDFQITLSIALMHLGLDANSSKQEDLDKAVEALREIKPQLGGLNSTNTVQVLSGGQATLIPSYTGNVYSAIKAGAANLDFELCKEGQLFNDDVMTIPVAAKHPGNAMLFLDWMLDAEHMAANVNYIGYPVPTKTGLSTYNDIIKDTPFLKFGTSLLEKPSAWQKGLTASQRTMWNNAWAKVQA